MNIVLRIFGLMLIFLLFPLTLIWIMSHLESFDIFSEWCIYGCRYEDSDIHKMLTCNY